MRRLTIFQIYFFLLAGFVLTQQRALGQTKADSVPAHIVFFSEAQKLQDSADFKGSISVLKKAIKEKKDYWEAYNLLATAQMKTGKYKDALRSLDKAEEIAPMNYQSLKIRGITQYHNLQYNESKRALDTAAYVAMEELIEDPELYYYRASLMFKGKSYREALGACDAALELDPGMTEAMVLKGEIRFATKEYRHAINDLSSAIKNMKPEDTDYRAYMLRAKSKFEAGDYRGAVNDWDAYLDAVPAEEPALVARAAAKININDNSGAVADLDEAIKINSKNPVSWCYRGVAKGGNKRFEEALIDLDQSIKLKFDYASAYVNRAAIKMAVKDKRGACADLEKADSLGSETAYKLIEQYCK